MAQNHKYWLRPAIICTLLLIYNFVLVFLNLDTLTVYHQYWRFFGTLTAQTVVIVLLFFVLIKRDKLRREREAKKSEQSGR